VVRADGNPILQLEKLSPACRTQQILNPLAGLFSPSAASLAVLKRLKLWVRPSGVGRRKESGESGVGEGRCQKAAFQVT
jgi:hypothetical protein